MMSKFQGSDHSCRRRYVALLLAERRRTRYTSARQYVKPYEKKPLEQESQTVTWQSADILNNDIFSTFQPSRSWRDRRPTVKQLFSEVSSNSKNFWKKTLNGHATVVGGHATVGWLSNKVFWTFQAIWENFEKSRWTVTRQWSEVTRPSADCQTTIFRRFKQLEIFLKKVAEQSRDSGRRSRDRRPTVKQRFLDVSSNLWSFEKSRWTVTRQWSEVTRPSADCQTTFFGRFKRFGKILKKVAERSRDSGRRSRERRPTVKQRIWTFQAIWENFEKSRWTVTWQWSEVTRKIYLLYVGYEMLTYLFNADLRDVVEFSKSSNANLYARHEKCWPVR